MEVEVVKDWNEVYDKDLVEYKPKYFGKTLTFNSNQYTIIDSTTATRVVAGVDVRVDLTGLRGG